MGGLHPRTAAATTVAAVLVGGGAESSGLHPAAAVAGGLRVSLSGPSQDAHPQRMISAASQTMHALHDAVQTSDKQGKFIWEINGAFRVRQGVL